MQDKIILCIFLCSSQNLQELQTYGEEKIVNNPIGALQEMCMSRHWPPPKYSMEGEEGLPHERQFTIVCSILKYREVGQGKSKKVAKRHAAHKMWQALHEMNNQAPSVDEDEVRMFSFLLIVSNNKNYLFLYMAARIDNLIYY